MTNAHAVATVDTDLVGALLSHTGAAPVRVGNPARRITLPPLGEAGDNARPILEATVAIATGNVAALACGGVHGLSWRVEWHERFNGKRMRYVGVLDPYIRKFTTTAPAEHVLSGFAVAAHGLAFAIPQSRFDGAWTALLATYANEGDKAFTADTIDTVRGVVLHALRVPGMRATANADYGGHGWPLWRYEQVDDVLELPALEDEPFTLQRARRHARGFTLERAFADLAAFATVGGEWERTVEQFPDANFVGPQVHDVFMALQAESHVVLIGPSGEGKSLCAADAISALERREFLTQIVPPVPLAHFSTPERLYGELTLDGDWVDGPLRTALLAEEGRGSVLHCTCDADLPAALVPLVRALLSQGVLPSGIVPGAPMTGIGERFRLVLEVTRPYADDGLPPNLADAVQGRAHVSVIPFSSPNERRAELLVHDVGVTGHQSLVFLVGYVVEEVRMAARDGALPRVLSSAEVLTWARMAVSMHGHALAGDAVPLLERAALATWVPAIPGAAAWWASTKPLALGEAVLRNRRGNNRLPDSPVDWFREPPGKRTWYRHEEVRNTIDAITSVVSTETYLVLRDESEQQTPSGFSTNGWWNGNRFCFVCLEMSTPPVDAFAEAVNVAAHERAHARWSPAARAVCFPDGMTMPDDESPEMRRLRLRQHHVYNLLEDHRIERLLDRIPDDALQTYRRRAAEIETAGATLHPSVRPSDQLSACLHHFTSYYTLDPDSAWDRLVELAEGGGLSIVHLMSAMNVMRLLEHDPHDVSFMRFAMNLLADVFAAADGESPHEVVRWGAAVVG